MRTSQRTSRALTALTLLCVLALGAGSASGAPSTFGGNGAGAGEFSQPTGIAIAGSTGEEVAVLDKNNARVDVFSAGGVFLRAFGWGVASDKEELQTCTSRCFAGTEGAGAGQMNSPIGFASDEDPFSASHGNLYVGELSENHRVQEFSPTGEFLLMFGGEVNKGTHGDVCVKGEACGIGVEGSGHGEFQFTRGNAIAVSPATGEVYVGDENRVQRFSEGGVFESEIALPGAGRIEQLAVTATGDIYVKSSERSGVREYKQPSGTEVAPVRDETGEPSTIAIGPSGDLLVADEAGGVHHILEYDAAGAQVSSFDALGARETLGLAFDRSSNSVYVLSNAKGRSSARVVEVPPPGPLVVSETAENLAPASATLTAVVNPEGQVENPGEEAKVHFEYGTTPSYGASTAMQASVGGNFEDRGVSAAVTGLKPATSYHFRVVVTNAAHETTFGPDQTAATLPAVLIENESAVKVSSDGARLETELNPQGAATEFHFEYDTTPYVEGQPGHGVSVPVPDASAGAGTEPEKLGLAVQGLFAETTYYYRVVAHNALGTVDGPARMFTTQGASTAVLIDGRAWEMVSPPQKGGATFEAIANEGAVIQAAADGRAITYAAGTAVTPDPEGNRPVANSQVLSTRTSPGVWNTADIATKHEEVAGISPGELSEYRLFSPDLVTAILDPRGATPLSEQQRGEEHPERTPYRRQADGSYTPLLTHANVAAGVKFGGEETTTGSFSFSSEALTATPDQSHILIGSHYGLSKEVESGTLQNIFEWDEGALRLVSILPNQVPTAVEGDQAYAGYSGTILRGALSSDGNRVVFGAGGGPTAPKFHLYLRDVALAKTVQLDAPEAGVRAPSTEEERYQTASSDGSRIFFSDEAKLTGDSTAREGEPDLYECEVVVSEDNLSCALKDLSVDRNVGESANVLADVVGADESGRYVYFTANGRLAAGAVNADCRSEALPVEPATRCNLYAEDTQTGSIRLVGVLSGADRRDWAATENGSDLAGLTARVSPNGQYLAFMSEQPLTGFDNRDAVSGERDEEVFEYSYGAQTLTCVSCTPSGGRPEGVLDPGGFPGMLVDRLALWQGQWLAASIPGWTRWEKGQSLYQSRYLSDNGRLFFNSATPLVPSDGNGLEDVYEYEPLGEGGCTLSSGCVGLTSSGTSSAESAFMDASENGDDVFFLTSAKLSSSDVDTAYDMYDAHVCSTEAPCAAPIPASPPPCGTADACRAAPAPQPDIFGSPASQTFSGRGSPTPPAAVKSKSKPLTRAQKLKKALAGCSKDKRKQKRAACERAARKRYGPDHEKVKRGR